MNFNKPNLDKVNELKYYLKFCLGRPYTWLPLTGYMSTRYLQMRRRLYTLLGHKNRLYNYPPEIRKEVQKIVAVSYLPDDWINRLPATGWAPDNGPSLREWAIPLATYSLPFSALDWYKAEPDQEDTFALHRFVWLLRWLSLHPPKECLNMADAPLLNWIEQIGPQQHLPAWETYSASERVVNWLLYLCATKNNRDFEAKFTKAVAASLLEHLHLISQQLEYYDNFYNNHILNNARALYIGGRLLQLSPIANVGRAIFERHIYEMIDERGALLEDSTHYQLLLTRTFVEVLWAAQVTEDTVFSKVLEPVTHAMASCCLYLGNGLSKSLTNNFPRVGDVSPDAPVSWYYPDPQFNQERATWWGIWDAEAISSLIKETTVSNKDARATPTEWRWISATASSCRVLVHTPQNLKIYPRGHGHLDFGSFLLYDESGPVLVDRGRSSYKFDNLSLYGISAKAHNTTVINGLPLVPNCLGLFMFYREYLQNDVEFKIVEDNGSPTLSWYSHAVNRLGRSLSWKRNLTLNSSGLEICEILSNPNNINLVIDSHLHWAPEFSIHAPSLSVGLDHSFVIEKPQKKYILKVECPEIKCQIDWFKGGSDDLYGWHFPEYGSKIPALSLRLSIQTRQDCTLKFSIYPL